MVKFKSFLNFKKFKPSPFFISQSIRIVLMLVIFILIPASSNFQLALTQPKVTDETAIQNPLPSPSPSPSQRVTKSATPSAGVANSVGSPPKISAKNSSPLCAGVTEPWKLVPNPKESGEYIICNAGSGQMATVDELNAEQNKYRQDHGLNTLSINSDLCKVAGERAKEISTNFSHDGFEAAIDRNHIDKNSVGENIASGPLTATQFVEWAWDKSPGHKANMLGDWNEGCAGVYDRFAVFIFAK